MGPPDWPHVKPVNLTGKQAQHIQATCQHPLDEEERVANACLYAEGKTAMGEDDVSDDEDDDTEDTLDEFSARSRCIIDSLLTDISNVDMVPGYTSWLDPRIKEVLSQFAHVFQKTLKNDHSTKFKPVRFNLRKDFTPPPRAGREFIKIVLGVVVLVVADVV